MGDPPAPAETPAVSSYALIGQHGRLLLLKDSTTSHSAHVLPGGPVRAGVPVEQSLREAVQDQLGARIAHLAFCAVVEHNTSSSVDRPSSEVALLFDATLTDPDGLATTAATSRCLWAGERELASLRPVIVRDALRAGTLSDDHPWWPWTP